MTDDPVHSPGGQRAEPSVEDSWEATLTAYGADEQSAKRLVESLQVHPELAFGDPSVDRVRHLVTESIDQLDLQTHGPATDADEARQIKTKLKETLSSGLDGEIPGPISLPPTDAVRTDEATPEPAVNSSSGVTASQPANPNRSRGFAYESPDESTSDRSDSHEGPADEAPTSEDLSKDQARQRIRESLEVLSTAEIRSLLRTEVENDDQQSDRDTQ